MKSTQWWLAKLDRYGNPTLVDGMHSERDGADQAFYLYQRLGYTNENSRYAVCRVELFDPCPNKEGVDEEALGICAALLANYRKDESP